MYDERSNLYVRPNARQGTQEVAGPLLPVSEWIHGTAQRQPLVEGHRQQYSSPRREHYDVVPLTVSRGESHTGGAFS